MTIHEVINKISSLIDISQQSILPIVEMALREIYTFSKDWDPVLWEFMLKRESFQIWNWAIKESLQTKYPIMEINNFYCWKIPVEINFKTWECDCIDAWCNCPVPLPECKCGCISLEICGCEADCWPLDLTRRSAKWKLCWDDYQVVWWECDFWWFWWHIVRVSLDSARCKCWWDWLWLEYYAGINPINCLSNKFPLPRSFTLAFLHIFQSLLVMKTDPELSAIMYQRFVAKMKTLSSFEWNTLYSIKYGDKD